MPDTAIGDDWNGSAVYGLTCSPARAPRQHHHHL